MPNPPAANTQGQAAAATEQNTPPGSPLLTESDFTAGRKKNEESLRQPVTVIKYPDQSAGSPINNPTHLSNSMNDYSSNFPQAENNPYAPFVNKRNWDIARWAKLRGPSSNALTELLGVEGVSDYNPFCYIIIYFLCETYRFKMILVLLSKIPESLTGLLMKNCLENPSSDVIPSTCPMARGLMFIIDLSWTVSNRCLTIQILHNT